MYSGRYRLWRDARRRAIDSRPELATRRRGAGAIPPRSSRWSGAATSTGAAPYRARGALLGLLGAAGLTLLVTREYEHLVLALARARQAARLVSAAAASVGLAVDRRRARARREHAQPEPGLRPRPVASCAAARRDGGRRRRRRSSPRGPAFYPALYLHDLAFVGGAARERRRPERRRPPRRERVRARLVAEVRRDAAAQLSSGTTCSSTRSPPGRASDSFFTASTDRLAPPAGPRGLPGRRPRRRLLGRHARAGRAGLTRPHSARLHERPALGGQQRLRRGRGCRGRAFRVASRAARLDARAGLPRRRRVRRHVARAAALPAVRARPRRSSARLRRARDRHRAGRVLGSLTWPDGNQVFAVEWVPRRVARRCRSRLGAPGPPRALYYADRPPARGGRQSRGQRAGADYERHRRASLSGGARMTSIEEQDEGHERFPAV